MGRTACTEAQCLYKGAVITFLLTVRPGMILVNNQTDAHFFLVCLFLFSTCFGQPCAHHQEKYCINATSGLCHSAHCYSRLPSTCPATWIHETFCVKLAIYKE